MKEVIGIYCVALLIGGYVALNGSIGDAILVGFATVGILFSAFLVGDIVKGRIENFYEKKYAPKRTTNAS